MVKDMLIRLLMTAFLVVVLALVLPRLFPGIDPMIKAVVSGCGGAIAAQLIFDIFKKPKKG